MWTWYRREYKKRKVNGMHPISKSIGANATFDLDNNWKISIIYVTQQTVVVLYLLSSSIRNSECYCNSFVRCNAKLRKWWTAFNNSNGLVARIHMFDTQLNDMSNFMNDLRLTKKIDNVGITLVFKSMQNVSMSWLWNSCITRSIGYKSAW
jgi:hypothetical protein